MVAVGSLILILFLSLIVVRIAAEALILTGVSPQAAQLQARWAWAGTGFTTTKAGQVVNYPVRRQVTSTPMLLRAEGLVTGASTLMQSFLNVKKRRQGLLRLRVPVEAALHNTGAKFARRARTA